MSKFIMNNEDISLFEKDKAEGRILDIVDYSPEKIGITTEISNRAGCYIVKL